MRESAAMLVDRHPEESVASTVGHLDGVEALRAIAVTWVVLFHFLVVREAVVPDAWNAWVAARPVANVIVRNGYLGVDLFFLITGFLLVLPWVRAAKTGAAAPAPAPFYIRRVRRIVPAYYVQLAVLFLVVVPAIHGTGFLRDNAGFAAANAVAHAAFAHYTTPVTSASLNVNGALWTLALEAQFYLLLPVLAPRFVRAPALVAGTLFAVAGAWRWLSANDLEMLVRWEMGMGARWQVPEPAIRHLLATQLPGYLGHFAMGMSLSIAWWRWHDRRPVPFEKAGWLLGLALAVAALDWAYRRGGGAALGPFGGWLLTIGALAVLAMALIRLGQSWRPAAAAAPILFVGRTSYSTYLYHLPILMLWNRFRILEGCAWALPAYLACVLLVAWASWRFVERRFMGR